MQWEEGLGHSCIFAKAGSKMTTNLSPRFHEVAHGSVWNIRLPVDKLLLRTYYASSTVLGLVPLVASQHYKLSVILQRRNPGPKEWSDWPKVVQPKGGKAGLCAPTAVALRSNAMAWERGSTCFPKALQVPVQRWAGMGATHSLTHRWWVYAMVQPHCKHFGYVYLHLPYGPAIPILGVYPRVMKAHVHTKTCTQAAALFVIAKN